MVSTNVENVQTMTRCGMSMAGPTSSRRIRHHRVGAGLITMLAPAEVYVIGKLVSRIWELLSRNNALALCERLRLVHSVLVWNFCVTAAAFTLACLMRYNGSDADSFRMLVVIRDCQVVNTSRMRAFTLLM